MVLNNNRKRKIVKRVSLTEQENQVLNQRVRASQSPSFQNYALQMLLTGQVVHRDFSELKQLRFEVAKLGANVNQLARAAHVYRQVDVEVVEEMMTSFQEFKEELDDLQRQIIQKD
ncbi:plasmid mobilization protein [Fructobacillus evanidus]|uniref:Bacterial mobilisation domain-containing protein n=1 Tax=Fructobacillus evanidus TaxID=3064281 RepID=A0ABM9MWZ3_9LACO|nr:hypothetical protein R55250_KEHBDPNM_00626 [Fructobacillus sp. LMG 32999]CAK1229814.1 hypothetical protein R53718_MFFEMHAI_00656 [Fructobacillus sp. LMG 32999]CAK1230825.1 hypothetical protein R53534_HOPDCFKK_00337 [Fructobacillus sp. LMG 32999]CAK1230894.1 hypothetical protein R54837_OMAIDLJD_00347 [Fructobacillus sp. LMG 32999]CAK1232029.1 hypothetical protein R55234_GCHJJDIB_00347 [Fructobacillus sp. LMG 32999]